jgi:hypothetical protein
VLEGLIARLAGVRCLARRGVTRRLGPLGQGGQVGDAMLELTD